MVEVSHFFAGTSAAQFADDAAELSGQGKLPRVSLRPGPLQRWLRRRVAPIRSVLAVQLLVHRVDDSLVLFLQLRPLQLERRRHQLVLRSATPMLSRL